MKSDKRVLVIGLIALLAGVVGMTASAAGGGWPESRGWPRFSHGSMMGWWGGTGTDDPPPASFDGVEEMRIEAGDLFFEPSALTIRADTPVNLTLTNNGRVFHDLTIAEVGFQLNADAGESVTGGLDGLSEGEYEFECTVPGHAAAGMVGTLTVEG